MQAVSETKAAFDAALSRAHEEGRAIGRAEAMEEIRQLLGLPPAPKRTRRLMGADRAEAIRLLEAGADRATIGETYGLTPAYVRGLTRKRPAKPTKAVGSDLHVGSVEKRPMGEDPGRSRVTPGSERPRVVRVGPFDRPGAIEAAGAEVAPPASPPALSNTPGPRQGAVSWIFQDLIDYLRIRGHRVDKGPSSGWLLNGKRHSIEYLLELANADRRAREWGPATLRSPD